MQPVARKIIDVIVMQLLFAHSIPGHSRPMPMGRPHLTLTWMDTAMHDMGSLDHKRLQIDLP